MHGSDVARGRQILARFLDLAEERLAYLIELYEAGRWQRYFTEAELLKNVREAKEAVAAWTLLVSTEALPNNRPVDLSWLDAGRPLPPRRPLMRDVEMPSLAHRFIEVELSSAPEATAPDLLLPTPDPIRVDVQAAAVPTAPNPDCEPPTLPPWQNALDYALMEQRYSLLRKSG